MEQTPREQAITDLIEEKGFMSVNALSAALYASPSSIRRDLAKLEEKKIVQRTHGGAVLSKDSGIVSPFFKRKAIHTEQKQKAAAKAAFLIHDGMTVMIDGSSTALQMLPHLKKHKDIRVFTNNLYTYQAAIEMGLEAYCFGGGPSADPETLSGIITEEAVSQIYTDMLFFSSKCVSENGDITDPVDGENRVRRIMLEHAKTRVFLYDTSKVGVPALYRLCNIRDVEYCFSDSDEH